MILKRQDNGKRIGVKIQKEFYRFDDILKKNLRRHRVSESIEEPKLNALV